MGLDGTRVDADVSPSGTATVSWSDDRVRHPVVLHGKERDLAAAVPAIGPDCQADLWPDHTVESAGCSLLPVHLDEVVATRSKPVSRPA
jgi:hypothetical protein